MNRVSYLLCYHLVHHIVPLPLGSIQEGDAEVISIVGCLSQCGE